MWLGQILKLSLHKPPGRACAVLKRKWILQDIFASMFGGREYSSVGRWTETRKIERLQKRFYFLQLLSNKWFFFDLQKMSSFTVFCKNNFFFLARQLEASRPDFLMCGDTALFCYLLRSHSGRSGPFRDVPASGGLGRMKLKTFSLKTRWFFALEIEGCICMAWCCCNMYHYPGATKCCRTGNDLAMIDTDWHKGEAKKQVRPITPEIWKTKISLRGLVILGNICTYRKANTSKNPMKQRWKMQNYECKSKLGDPSTPLPKDSFCYRS